MRMLHPARVIILVFGIAWAAGCSSDTAPQAPASTTGGAISAGGATSSGGTTTSATGGAAGSPQAGGNVATGGSAAGGAATGGSSSSLATGGVVIVTGGRSGTGGATSMGGMASTGGVTGTGGNTGAGGLANTGGAARTGGTTGTGGVVSSGGTTTGTGGQTTSDAGTSMQDGARPDSSGTGGIGGTGGTGGDVPLDPALLAKCTGSNPIKCDLPFANGNYKVTVELGSATASATTRVLAETRRIVLQPTATAAGAYTRFTFAVNVRAENHGGYSAPGGILNLTFDGSAPAVHGVGVAATAIPTLFIASDSTVCDWDPPAYTPAAFAGFTDFAGWGQEVSQYFNAGLAVANYADSGETAGSFYTAYYPPAKAAMKQGDFLIVEFGHNDMKSDSSTTYRTNLTKYLTDAAAKSVTPILITPVSRSGGAGFVSQIDNVALDATMRQLASDQKVALVDLTKLSSTYYGTLSSSAKSALFIDGTHFHEGGATQIANLVVQALKSATTGLEKYIR
jgi:lysophospholipase L1-like esterase